MYSQRQRLGLLGSVLAAYALVTGCSDNKHVVGREGVKYIGREFTIQDVGSPASDDHDVVRINTADGLGRIVDVPVGLNGELDTDHDDGAFGRVREPHVHYEDPINVVVRNDLVNKRSYVIPQKDYGNVVTGQLGKTKGKGINWSNLAKYASGLLFVGAVATGLYFLIGAIRSRRRAIGGTTTGPIVSGSTYGPSASVYGPASTTPSLGRTMRRPTVAQIASTTSVSGNTGSPYGPYGY